MQVTVYAKDSNDVAEAIYRTVVSEEIKRQKARYEQEIEDLTAAHQITEDKLNAFRRKDLNARKQSHASRLESIRNHMAEAWGVLWGLMLEFELIVQEDDE